MNKVFKKYGKGKYQDITPKRQKIKNYKKQCNKIKTKLRNKVENEPEDFWPYFLVS